MKYLLDTDTCIALLRGHQSAVERAEAVSPDELGVSSITRYELRYGALRCSGKRRSKESRKVSLFLDLLHELPFTNETAEEAAELRHSLESSGHPIGPMDTLIAATAIESGLTLVTGNQREFSRIKGLALENWMT